MHGNVKHESQCSRISLKFKALSVPLMVGEWCGKEIIVNKKKGQITKLFFPGNYQ